MYKFKKNIYKKVINKTLTTKNAVKIIRIKQNTQIFKQ